MFAIIKTATHLVLHQISYNMDLHRNQVDLTEVNFLDNFEITILGDFFSLSIYLLCQNENKAYNNRKTGFIKIKNY